MRFGMKFREVWDGGWLDVGVRGGFWDFRLGEG